MSSVAFYFPHFVLNLMMKNSEDRLFLSWKRAYAKLRYRAYDSLMVIFINGNGGNRRIVLIWSNSLRHRPNIKLDE